MNRTAAEWNEEADKIGRLSAAAPELLEACRVALPFLQEYRERVIKGRITGELLPGDFTITRMLEAAITNAEGINKEVKP